MNPYIAQRKLANIAFGEGLQDIDEATVVDRSEYLLSTLVAITREELDQRVRSDPTFPYAKQVATRIADAEELLPKLKPVSEGLRSYELALKREGKDAVRAFLVIQSWVTIIDQIAPVYDALMECQGLFSRSWT